MHTFSYAIAVVFLKEIARKCASASPADRGSGSKDLFACVSIHAGVGREP